MKLSQTILQFTPFPSIGLQVCRDIAAFMSLLFCFVVPLWTTSASGEVKLRIDSTCSQTPVTIHQMFQESLQKYGSLSAMASKKNGIWETITFWEYYNLSRKAAKSFLKVNKPLWEGAQKAPLSTFQGQLISFSSC